MTEITSQSSAMSKMSHRIKYFIPLAPFERHLVAELAAFLDASQEATAFLPLATVHSQSSFEDWQWTDYMQELKKEFDDEQLREEHDGDKGHAYEEFMASRGRKEGGLELARVQQIKEANQDFINKIENTLIEEVEFCPADEDLHDWETITRVYDLCGRKWKTKTFRNLHGSFDIWKLVRMFIVFWDNRNIDETALEFLLSKDQFWESFELETQADEGAELAEEPGLDIPGPMKFCSRPNRDAEQWPEKRPRKTNDGRITMDYLEFQLRRAGSRKEVNDPRGYVHVIQWNDLELVELRKLQSEGVDSELPFNGNFDEVQWTLWTPPHPSSAWNHQIFTEEEVFGYNILNDWTLPDHALNGQIIFAMRKIESTGFIPSLYDFWETWNDCAITRKSPESPLLLLETIPGLRFRHRLKAQDRTAARNYYRNLVEAHASGTLHTSPIRAILGPDGYSSQYEQALRVIPYEQLSKITWGAPLGKGENGAVYAATWDRPASVLTTTTVAGPVDVVLKDIVSRRGQNQQLTKRVLKELDLTFSSLAGLGVGCVKFFGITVVYNTMQYQSDNDKISDCSQDKDLDASKILLVFEKATQGTIPEFLESYLSGIEFVESWDRTAGVLSSIAAGIQTLHRNHVLHRDLHLNNILVTDRYFPHDIHLSHEFQYLLSDLGEGKVLRDELLLEDLTAHRASYGATEFRAPEVQGNYGWSTAAEVFSYGVIACKILDLRSYFSRSMPSDSVLKDVENESLGVEGKPKTAHLVPFLIRAAVEPCLSHLPDERPSIGKTTQLLNRLLTNFTRDRMYPEDEKGVKWTYWDWNESLRKGHLGTATSRAAEAGSPLEELADIENLLASIDDE